MDPTTNIVFLFDHEKLKKAEGEIKKIQKNSNQDSWFPFSKKEENKDKELNSKIELILKSNELTQDVDYESQSINGRIKGLETRINGGETNHLISMIETQIKTIEKIKEKIDFLKNEKKETEKVFEYAKDNPEILDILNSCASSKTADVYISILESTIINLEQAIDDLSSGKFCKEWKLIEDRKRGDDAIIHKTDDGMGAIGQFSTKKMGGHDKRQNEDQVAVYSNENKRCVVLADGTGGSQNGVLGAKRALGTAIVMLSSNETVKDKKIMSTAAESIILSGKQNNCTTGSTLCYAISKKDKASNKSTINCASIGDSSILLFDPKNKKVSFLTPMRDPTEQSESTNNFSSSDDEKRTDQKISEIDKYEEKDVEDGCLLIAISDGTLDNIQIDSTNIEKITKSSNPRARIRNIAFSEQNRCDFICEIITNKFFDNLDVTKTADKWTSKTALPSLESIKSLRIDENDEEISPEIALKRLQNYLQYIDFHIGSLKRELISGGESRRFFVSAMLLLCNKYEKEGTCYECKEGGSLVKEIIELVLDDINSGDARRKPAGLSFIKFISDLKSQGAKEGFVFTDVDKKILSIIDDLESGKFKLTSKSLDSNIKRQIDQEINKKSAAPDNCLKFKTDDCAIGVIKIG